MFINKLNQIYKPDRLLYYIPVTEDDIHAYPKGLIPEKVRAYSGAFGTYDYPEKVYCLATEPPLIAADAFGVQPNSWAGSTLYVPKGSEGLYRSAQG
ncbi:MAG: hypothetical protein VZR24_23275, partial [Butyrivibrio hungatei]|nr:hypothetical protein [Butyrivibrio hungatei]